MKISVSILNAKDKKETIKTLNNTDISYFHIDVMDGKFVSQDTYHKMIEYSNYIKRISNLPLDIHLMVEDVETGIEVFSADEPNIITFHLEACKNKEEVMKNINLIKEKGSRVGIAIKPETPIEKVYEYLPYIHMCLIMTVEPGKGGQTLITDMIAKIDELKTYAEKNSLEIDIEADGGINLKTAERVKNAGANILVAGTAILKAADYKVILDELKQE